LHQSKVSIETPFDPPFVQPITLKQTFAAFSGPDNFQQMLANAPISLAAFHAFFAAGFA